MPTVVAPDGERVITVDSARNSRPFSEVYGAGSSSALSMLDGRTISHGDIYASQPNVAAVMDWFIWKTVLVPLKTYRRTGPDAGERTRLRPEDHRLAAAIQRPWPGPTGTSAALAQNLLGPLLAHGNSLSPVEDGARGRSLRFRPVDWRGVQPVKNDDGDIVGWTEQTGGGDKRGLGRDSTMHIAWWSPLGPLGISPLRKLGTTVRSTEAAQRWAHGSLSRGFRPNGVVQLDERFLDLEPAGRQAIYDATAQRFWRAYGRGASSAGEVPILPPGVTWADAKPTTAVEAQLIEQRKIDREEICGVLQLPPPLVGILDHGTYDNLTTLRQVGYTDGLAPPLVMIEAAINAVVCQDLLREPDIYVEFDFGGVLRGDRLQEIQSIREAIATAAMTPNEGRDMLNRPRSKNTAADELYLPMNNLKKLGTEPTTGGRRSTD